MPNHELDPRLPSERLVIVEQNYKQILEKLDEIKEQTTLTNGRVNSLEAWKDKASGILLVWPLLAIFIGNWATNKFISPPVAAPAPRSTVVYASDGITPIVTCTWSGEGMPDCKPIQKSEKK